MHPMRAIARSIRAALSPLRSDPGSPVPARTRTEQHTSENNLGSKRDPALSAAPAEVPGPAAAGTAARAKSEKTAAEIDQRIEIVACGAVANPAEVDRVGRHHFRVDHLAVE